MLLGIIKELRMDKTRAVFLVLLFFFIFFTPAGNAPHISTANELFTWKTTLIYSVTGYPRLLKSSTYEPGLVFGESFLPQEIVDLGNRVWDLESTEELIQGSDELMELVSPHELIYFKNVSGIYEGSWNQSVFQEKLEPIKLEIPDLFKPSDNLTSSLLFQSSNSTSPKGSTTINDHSKGNITENFGKRSHSLLMKLHLEIMSARMWLLSRWRRCRSLIAPARHNFRSTWPDFILNPQETLYYLQHRSNTQDCISYHTCCRTRNTLLRPDQSWSSTWIRQQIDTKKILITMHLKKLRFLPRNASISCTAMCTQFPLQSSN